MTTLGTRCTPLQPTPTPTLRTQLWTPMRCVLGGEGLHRHRAVDRTAYHAATPQHAAPHRVPHHTVPPQYAAPHRTTHRTAPQHAELHHTTPHRTAPHHTTTARCTARLLPIHVLNLPGSPSAPHKQVWITTLPAHVITTLHAPVMTFYTQNRACQHGTL